ncbi:MAG: hypothetical protein HYT70_04755, partial [Candidatus Aenigmarchaeota archaeon]|nr:hypothetical protein [Candidatus Aenigmarchaeota archaeon]
DVLIIWGYKNLDSSIAGLSSFVKSGGGVIEIADMQQAQVTLPQQRIFGLKWLTNNPFPLTGSDQFVKPLNASSTTYQSYKWFYHLPYNLTALPSGPIPTEGGIAPCGSSATTGNFRFHSTTRKFWICGGASVYLDTNTMPNDIADTIKLVKQNFTIDNSNFLLSYIEGSSKIRVSFKQDYAFNDFLVRDNTYNKLYPIDNDIGKILLNFGYWDLLQEQPVAVAILNGTSGKTVWLADFGRNGLASTGDDHKQLLSALIFSVVNRETTQTFSTIGKITSYVNTNNTDIFEVYRIDLEVGSPF